MRSAAATTGSSGRAPLRALPRVIGHRGAAGDAPENTLAGFRRAKELGATWVEFDVKLTADGHPVLMHDDRLERTTDGIGRVRDSDLKALKTLSAGRWFDPSFGSERVPTLEEALALCAELGLGVNVEIKPCRGRAAETARVVVETVATRWPSTSPAPLVSSFAAGCLEVAREVAPELPRGFLANHLPRGWREAMARYDCATLHLNHRWLRPRQLATIQDAGIPLVLYTVNSAERARQHLDHGAASVIGDHVDRLVAAAAPTDDLPPLSSGASVPRGVPGP